MLMIGLLIALPSLIFHILTGAIYPVGVEPWDKDPLEVTGLSLLMSFMPAYLAMCFIATTRLNSCTHADLGRLLPADYDAAALFYRWGKWWSAALVLALVYAFGFNIGWFSLSFDPADPRFGVSISIVVGQSLVWMTAGLLLFFSLHEVLVLHRLGKLVAIDLYCIDSLNGFGRTALNGFLIVMGAMALTFLQSINQTFVFRNYLNAFIVGLPAVLILVPLPIWSVHRRIQEAKYSLLRDLDDRIKATPKSLEGEELHDLNALLQRREQVQKTRNWPMDLSISTRFVVYVFIVPLAWAGAALMEVLLDNVLGL